MQTHRRQTLIGIAIMLAALLQAGATSEMMTPQKKAKPAKAGEAQATDADKDKAADDKDKKAEDKKPDDKGDQPKSLFEGKMGIKSSRQTKDSATLGFNGIDPEGKVEKAMLDSNPTAKDESSARLLARFNPSAEEIQKFADDGHLKITAKPAPAADAKTTDSKKKEKKP